MRLSIPRIIQTLLDNHPMPQDLYWNFRQTVTDVRKRLGDFENTWNGGQTQDVLEHAKEKSRGVKTGLRDGYAGGDGDGDGDAYGSNGGVEESFDGKEEERKKNKMMMMMVNNGVEKGNQGVVGEGVEGEGSSVESQAQINAAVGRLKESHPNFKVDLDEEEKSIKVSVETL